MGITQMVPKRQSEMYWRRHCLCLLGVPWDDPAQGASSEAAWERAHRDARGFSKWEEERGWTLQGEQKQSK